MLRLEQGSPFDSFSQPKLNLLAAHPQRLSLEITFTHCAEMPLDMLNAPYGIKSHLQLRNVINLAHQSEKRIGDLGKCFRGGKARKFIHAIDVEATQ